MSRRRRIAGREEIRTSPPSESMAGSFVMSLGLVGILGVNLVGVTVGRLCRLSVGDCLVLGLRLLDRGLVGSLRLLDRGLVGSLRLLDRFLGVRSDSFLGLN